MFTKEKRVANRWIPVLVIGALAWGLHPGRLVYSNPTLRSVSTTVPSNNGPTAQVHPEVLNLQASFSKVADIVKPAVVSISTIHIERIQESQQFYFGDPMEQFFEQFYGGGNGSGEGNPYPARPPQHPHQFKMEGVGSGVIIDPDGLVLTNEHVVHDADEIKVLIYDVDGNKKEYKGKVVGKDARTDIAVVKIHAGRKLPFAALGDSEKVKVGDWAIAIGSPFGLAQTLTVGVISAARQSLAIEDREYRNLIQTDAAINRGNSGGPLLNIRGEIVGINTAIYAPTGVFAGIGFAVPINQAKAILEDLINKGHVTRGWLGVELGREITPAMVNAFGLSDTKGALVNEVLKNSPAEKAGLKRGDVIRSFGGKAVESSDKLQAMVAQTPPKKAVPLEVIRGRKDISLSLVLGERPDTADEAHSSLGRPESHKPGKPDQQEWQGAHVVRLTPAMAENFRQPAEAEGVLVTDVEPNSNAEEIGLLAGDVIRSVNQIPTPTLSSFGSVAKKVDLSDGVVLDVLRQGHSIYLSYTKGK